MNALNSPRMTRTISRGVWLMAMAYYLGGSAASAWSPGTSLPSAADGFVVDTSDRTDVLSFYNTVYTASQGYQQRVGWTGNLLSGLAGDTNPAFKEDVRRRINFYRALAGVPADVVFTNTKNHQCQLAALMCAVNGAISHSPPLTWLFYSSEGAEAASKSNLYLGQYGPDAVDGYIVDPGAGNYRLGHRRWILYSRANEMGTGDIPSLLGKSTNAIWVIGNQKPSASAKFIPWPNSGYVPQNLVPARWSLSYPGANFSSASVTMSQGATSIPVAIISKSDNGYGDNTIAWEPNGVLPQGQQDITYNVTVSGITGTAAPSSYSYSVRAFNPGVLGQAVVIAGSGTPSVAGATYSFNGVVGAEKYELRVSTTSSASWAEGAENTATITDLTSLEYSLDQTSVKKSGSKGFHLTFPNLASNAQGFELNREIIPSATSQLIFHELFRFATSGSRLSAEISQDNGSSWSEIWFRNGNGSNSSAGWDNAFQARSLSLAAYSGKPLRVRFMYRFNGTAFLASDNNSGVFIDDISVSNSTHFSKTITTELPGSATSFALNATTAGGPLAVGNSYYLHIRPNVGTKWFGEGTPKLVTLQAATGFDAWLLAQYPTLVGGPTGDHDGDGISNLVEYAFGMNPTRSTSAASLPQPVLQGNTLRLSYTASAAGVVYGAQWSTDLVNWNAIPDSGSGNVRTFVVSTAGKDRLVFRHRISTNP